MAVLDDQRRDARRRFATPARRRGARDARAGGAVALGGRLDRRHERHARGDDPAALELRRRRLAGPRADADAGDPDAARGGDPRVRAREVLAGRREVRATDDGRRYEGRFHAGAQPRITSAEEADGDRRGRPRRARRDHQARQDAAHRARADALRPHVAAARGQHPLRLLARGARSRAAQRLLRGAQGAHLSAYELALPDLATWSRTSSRPPSASAATDAYAKAAAYVHGPGPPAARPRRRRRQGRRPPRDHPDQRPSTRSPR